MRRGARRSLTNLAAVAVALACGAAALAGCQSTQDKSAKIDRTGSDAFTKHGLRVKHKSKDIAVRGTKVLQDENGAAVVIKLRNRSDKQWVRVPVSIKVRGRGKSGRKRTKTLFSNSSPGIEPALAGPSYLDGEETLFWVHDQVLTEGKLRSVKARVGPAKQAPSSVPRIQLSEPRFERDETSGDSVLVQVWNRSKVLQRDLRIYCVAERGDEIVAAGRGGIEKLKPGAKARVPIFFIGNPTGGQVRLAAPPTSFN